MWRAIRSWFAWRVAWDTGITIYEENAVTGERRARRRPCHTLHQPVDQRWLDGA